MFVEGGKKEYRRGRERKGRKKRKREREKRKEREKKKRKGKVGELLPHISSVSMGPKSKARLRDMVTRESQN